MNPHTRYEYAPIPHARLIAFIAAVLTGVMLVVTLALLVTTPGQIIPPSPHRIELPTVNPAAVKANIQKHVDESVSGKAAQR